MFSNFYEEMYPLTYKKSNISTITINGWKNNNNRYKCEPLTVSANEFTILYDEFMCGLGKYLTYDNYVLTGGSLHDVLTHNFVSSLRLQKTNVPKFAHGIIYQYLAEPIDLDLFVYNKTVDEMTHHLVQLVENLRKKYSVGILVHGPIIEIILKEIPRSLQFVFTKMSSPSDIVLEFDSSHVMMYWNGKELMMESLCKKTIETQITYHPSTHTEKKIFGNLQKIYNNPVRMYKILERGYNINMMIRWYEFYSFSYNRCKNAYNGYLTNKKILNTKIQWINLKLNEDTNEDLEVNIMIYIKNIKPNMLYFGGTLQNSHSEYICKERYLNHIECTNRLNKDAQKQCVIS